VNAHVDFQSTRIIKTLLTHIALVLPSLSLHSFRSGNNKSLWHVMMILLHRDIFIVFTGRTATEHPQQPKLFVSLFFFSSSKLSSFSSPFKTVFTFLARIGCGFFLRPPIIIVACILASLLLLVVVRVFVFGASRTPKKRVRKQFFSLSRPFVFFKFHTLNNRKNQIFLFRCNTSSNLLRYCAIHSRAFVASNDGRCLRFKPLILAEKERRSSSFFNHRFFLHIYIYIYKQRKNKKVKEIISKSTRRFGRLIS